jgi:hypothetical protein
MSFVFEVIGMLATDQGGISLELIALKKQSGLKITITVRYTTRLIALLHS